MHEQFTRLPMRLGWFLLAVGMVAGLVLTGLRLRVGSADRTVALVLDGRSFRVHAQKLGTAYPDLLRALKQQGATAVSVADMDLNALEAEGLLTALTGAEVRRKAAAGGLAPALAQFVSSGRVTDGYTYVLTDSAVVRDMVQARVERARLQEVAPGVLEIAYGKDRISQLTFGYLPAEIAEVRASGLLPVPRPGNDPAWDEPKVSKTIEDLTVMLPEARMVIFQGNEVLGYPNALGATAAALRSANLTVGIVQKANQPGYLVQKGFEQLTALLDYRVVPVGAAPDAIAAGARAVYVKAPERGSAAEAVAATVTGIEARGYTPGAPAGFQYVRVGRSLQFALSLGAVGAVILLLGSLLPLSNRVLSVLGASGFLAAAAWPYLAPSRTGLVAGVAAGACTLLAAVLTVTADVPQTRFGGVQAAGRFLAMGLGGGLIAVSLLSKPATLLGISGTSSGTIVLGGTLMVALSSYVWLTRHEWHPDRPITLGDAAVAGALLASVAAAYLAPALAAVLVGAATLLGTPGRAVAPSTALALIGSISLAVAPEAGLLPAVAGVVAGFVLHPLLTHMTSSGRLGTWPDRGRETA